MYEPIFAIEKTGVQIAYYNIKRWRYPVHWHSAIEVIYIFNGKASLMIQGKDYSIVSGECIVVDSNQIHELHYEKDSMMIVMHFPGML